MIIRRRATPKIQQIEEIEEALIETPAPVEAEIIQSLKAETSDINETKQEPAAEQKNEPEMQTGKIQADEPLNTEVQTQLPPVEEILTPEMELQKKLDEIEKIDISSLEFKERFERRRGERRRGYRRIEEAHKELENLKASLAEFLNSKKEAYDAISGDMLELSLEIAKKIIKKEVELSQDVLKGVLTEVFDEVSSNEEKITIKVAPDEVEFARASMPEVLKNSVIDAKIVIAADETVEKGSCVVITSNGVIDANFSTQLSIIQNAFGIYKGGN